MESAWPLVFVVALAHTIETVTGFGATVFALAVGSLWLPLDPLLTSLVVVGWLQSAWIVARDARLVLVRFLGLRVLPLAGVGLVAGRLLAESWPTTEGMKTLLGVFVVAAAGARLLWLLRSSPGSGIGSGVGAVAARIALPLVGGFFHGLFASGGPVIVYLTAAEVPDKGEFRATMSALWLLLNSVLLVVFARSGAISHAWPLAFALVPGLLAGIGVGQWLHARVEQAAFRVAVQAVLMAVGCVLVVA